MSGFILNSYRFGVATAAPTIVSSQSTDTANGTNRTVTLSQAPASGSTLLVLVNSNTASSITSLTDNQSNTYTAEYNDTDRRMVFKCNSITNAPTTLNFTNISAILRVRVFEISAPLTLSVAGGQTTGSNVTTLTRSHTTIEANEVVCGWMRAATFVTTSDVLPADVLNQPAIGSSSSDHMFCAVVPTAGATNFKQTSTTSMTAPALLTISFKGA